MGRKCYEKGESTVRRRKCDEKGKSVMGRGENVMERGKV